MGAKSSVIKIFRCMICNEHEYTENEVNLLYTEERCERYGWTWGDGTFSVSICPKCAVEDVKSESSQFI